VSRNLPDHRLRPAPNTIFRSYWTGRPESSKLNTFWIPDQARYDGFGTFYESIKLSYLKYFFTINKIESKMEEVSPYLSFLSFIQICIDIPLKIQGQVIKTRGEGKLQFVYELNTGAHLCWNAFEKMPSAV